MTAEGEPRNNKPWVYRSFFKDGKLRSRERYFHPFGEEKSWVTRIYEKPTTEIVIPDALTLRKYLPCIQSLISDLSNTGIHWVLLESVVEYLDYRNQSPVLDGEFTEPTAPQERQVLRRLCAEECDNFSVLCDCSFRECCDEWDLLLYESMDIQSRTNNALLRAASMLQSANCEVAILSDGLDNVDEGVSIYNLVEYLHYLEKSNVIISDERARLADQAVKCVDSHSRRNSRRRTQTSQDPKYGPISDEDIEAGIRSGGLLCGRLIVTKENIREAFVPVDGKTFFVDMDQGHNSCALLDDEVIICPLPESEWGRPVGKRKLAHYNENLEVSEDNVFEADPYPSARVVGIKSAGRREFVATMVEAPKTNESKTLFVPMDMRIPKIRVTASHEYTGKRALIRIDEWEAESKYPNGHCVKILGPIGCLDTEIAALLHNTQVNLTPFSLHARACLPHAGGNWRIPNDELRCRLDLRQSRRVFSVDPPGCQDIDDTMHAEVLPNGDVEIGVHIADVSFFVEHESALDLEAQARGTTFYLVDRRFDMLPSLLSSNLCSLHGGVDRLAVSVVWVLSSDLQEVKSTWFGRSVINNCAAMTYEQADRILSGTSPVLTDSPAPPALTAGAPVNKQLIPSLKTDLEILTRLGRKLKKDREEKGGAVDLSSGDLGSELKFSLSSGSPTKVMVKEDKEIHHTIAEMMIMANSSVAEKIHNHFPREALLRIHQSVEEDRFSELNEILKAANIRFDGSSNKSLAESLKEAQKSGSAFVQSLLKSLATRAMSEAKYICTEGRSLTGLSHYGLGIQKYTHFTSPIRRYADVIVHKQLLAIVEQKVSNKRPLISSKQKPGLSYALPASNVISVLSATDGSSTDGSKLDLHSEIKGSNSVSETPTNTQWSRLPYAAKEVSTICDTLNLHNRLAKRASKECQGLFLSLYFKSHTSVERGIVTDVRANGFICYVPKFDMRAPVFLQDHQSVVQMDPSFLGLPPNAGLPATNLFNSFADCRRIPGAKLLLVNTDSLKPVLEVSSPESKQLLRLRPLDEVQVCISCPNWDARARIPAPLLHLASNSVSSSFKPKDTAVESPAAQNFGLPPPKAKASLFSVLSSPVPPELTPGSSERKGQTKFTPRKRNETLLGRIVHGDFVNPDSLAAMQEASQEVAAEQAANRRTRAAEIHSKVTEYDESNRIQRESTLRQQRLQAGKRNARHGKKT